MGDSGESARSGEVAAATLVASRPVDVGRVRHAFPRASAAIVELSGALAVGDWGHVRGATTDWVDRVRELRRRDTAVDAAGPGESIGLAVAERVRVGDRVFRLELPEDEAP